jgi:hypothetical protein
MQWGGGVGHYLNKTMQLNKSAKTKSSTATSLAYPTKLAACFQACFLLGLFLDSKDGSDVPPKRPFPLNALHGVTLHNHRCENLKSYK